MADGARHSAWWRRGIRLSRFRVLGIALTIGAVLLIAVPVVIAFAIFGSLFNRRL